MLVVFALVLARMLGLLLGAPVFSSKLITARYKAALAAMLAISVLPAAVKVDLPSDGAAVAIAMAVELAFGFAIGLSARLMLVAFQLAGRLMAFQMGFALATAFDPDTEANSTLIGTLYGNLAVTLFLVVDGHHFLLRSVAQSVITVPVGGGFEFGAISQTLMAAMSTAFVNGVKIAAPVTGVLLLINGTVGFLNRIMPQLSIFSIGFPLSVMGGLFAILLAAPEAANFFFHAYAELEQTVATLVAG